MCHLHDGDGEEQSAEADQHQQHRDVTPLLAAAEFRRFAGPTVPLARLASRIYTSDQTLESDVEIYNFGEKPIFHELRAMVRERDQGDRRAFKKSKDDSA